MKNSRQLTLLVKPVLNIPGQQVFWCQDKNTLPANSCVENPKLNSVYFY